MLAWLHPTVVHFAIGLLFAGFFFDVLALWRSSEKLLFAGFWNTVFGAVATLVAVGTGLLAESELAAHDEIGGALLPFHRVFAYTGTVFAVVLAVARVAMRGYILPRTRTVYLCVSFLGAGLLIVAGALGGALVYGYGLGVTPAGAQRVLDAQPPKVVAPAPKPPPPDAPTSGRPSASSSRSSAAPAP